MKIKYYRLDENGQKLPKILSELLEMRRDPIATLKKELAKITWTDLVWDKEAKEHDEVEKPLEIIERDGKIYISGEDGTGIVDYYGEFSGGDPYIDPRLVAAAEKAGGYWEWESAGSIVFTF